MADRDLPNCCARGNQAWPDPCPTHAPGRTPSPLPEWCGAGFYTPVTTEDGRITGESRRMCGLKEPHEWHQDRFDATFRWKALLPFAEREHKVSVREYLEMPHA